jgi:hypothetical protein
MLAEGNLNRVQNFDEDDNQQNAVEQHYDIFRENAGEQVLSKEDDFTYEESPSDCG